MQKITEVLDDKHSDRWRGGFGEAAFEFHNEFRNVKEHLLCRY